MPNASARQAMKELLTGYAAGDYIRAMDIFTGKKVWNFRDSERSGVLSTAGGVSIYWRSKRFDCAGRENRKRAERR